MADLRNQRTIKISVVSDVVCPWCFICAKEIDATFDRLRLSSDSSVKFELEHRPYLLNPTWQDDESHNMDEHFRKSIGPERWGKVQKVLAARGKEVGIRFQCNGFISSTLRAHRLLLLAWQKGGSEVQTKLLNVLYQACFERSEDVGDISVLATKAEQSGLMSEEEAIQFLKSDELAADVHRMVICAQRNGVKGVPFTVIDGRWAISGGQTSDIFYKVLEKLVHGQEPFVDGRESPSTTC